MKVSLGKNKNGIKEHVGKMSIHKMMFMWMSGIYRKIEVMKACIWKKLGVAPAKVETRNIVYEIVKLHMTKISGR